jgi:hypothetical protein
MDTSSHSLLHAFGPSIWTVEGPTVPFLGCPYLTRTALIQLENGGIWVWSPVKLTDELLLELKAQQLDNIAYIVSPNKIHHIFLKEWQEAFPQAKLYAPPGLQERAVVKDVTFHALLEDEISLFSEEISQVIVRGSSVMEEVVFYHAKSQTALVADLIQRFPEHHVEGFIGTVMKCNGVVGLNGSTPREWRLSFLFGKDQARKARDIIINDWKPKHLIIAHGDCVTDGSATTVIDKALGWLDQFHAMW